jgi:hypothetical protein
MKTKIGNVTIDLMKASACQCVGWGSLGLLGEAFDKSGARIKNPHPLNRNKAVLDALDRDERFEKFYYNIYGKRCRVFKLIPSSA